MTEQNVLLQLAAAMGKQPAPIYAQVKQAIIQHISDGTWKPNQKIPSEHELVNSLGVSRMTINRALRELASEGFLLRMQGVGTFVAECKGYSIMQEVHNIAEEITLRGHVHSSKVVQLESMIANHEQATQLGLKAGQPIFHSLIVHYQNDVPVQLEDRLVNPQMAPDYLHHDYQKQTPHIYLMNVAPLSAGEHVVEAILPTQGQQKLLMIDSKEPCLLIRRTTWCDASIVTYANLIYPGTRYKLVGKFQRRG